MKPTLRPVAAFLCLALVSPLLALGDRETPKAEPATPAANPFLGTWRLASAKYRDAKEFSDFPKEMVELKHVTDTHFAWVVYEVATKKVTMAAGGTYTLSGNRYTEHLDYGLGEGVSDLVGKDQVFTCKVEGDKLHQSGTLSTGIKIEEVWVREKGGSAQEPADGAKQ